MHRIIASFAAAALAACAGIADETAAPAPASASPTPACAGEAAPYRDFDFWVGDWEVFAPGTDKKHGDNLIEKRDGGCLILERWTNVGGGTGLSMNLYDPLRGAWRQIWMSKGVFIDYEGGLDDSGAMTLEGVLHDNVAGGSAPFRGRWTAKADGSVLQEFWIRNAETGAWDVWFVGEYRRRVEG